MAATRVFLLAFLLGWVCPALAEVAVPQLTGRVVDQTGTLSSSDIAALNGKLEDLEKRKGSQIAVLIVPTTGEEAIEQFSIRVAEAWKIGRKKVDDGALLVVAKNDRHLRIEVGYGLEGVLSDVVTHRIIDEVIAPKFKAGDFAGGISAGVDRMIGLINGEQLPAPEPEHWQAPNNFLDFANPVAIFFVVIVAGVLRAMLGRLLGSAATGGVVGAFVWLVAGSLATATVLGLFAFVAALIFGGLNFGGPVVGSGPYRRSGGYPGGFPGGGWSGGSGSGGGGGGFSGGGGSFGGGGASGSW